jgi:hypothetical protein
MRYLGSAVVVTCLLLLAPAALAGGGRTGSKLAPGQRRTIDSANADRKTRGVARKTRDGSGYNLAVVRPGGTSHVEYQRDGRGSMRTTRYPDGSMKIDRRYTIRGVKVRRIATSKREGDLVRWTIKTIRSGRVQVEHSAGARR